MVAPNGSDRSDGKVKKRSHTRAVLTDSHFLVPAIVFLTGVLLLVAMH